MKKLISMMLLLCAMVTFTACSSDDDGNSNSPISNIVVPTTAAIGTEQTIQGSGFASGMTLQLCQYDNYYDVNAKMTANGATFTIPYTVRAGETSVILKQGDQQWTIGTITLTDPANPIISPKMPEVLCMGQTYILEGSGFEEGDHVDFTPVDDPTLGISAGLGTITSDGLQFEVPKGDMTEGQYEAYICRGENKWLLGTVTIVKARRIKSIVYENPMVAMLGVEKLTLNFEYDGMDGKLKAITCDAGTNWNFTYNATGENTYEIVTQSPICDAMMTFTMENGKIKTSTPCAPYDDTEKTNTWTYNGNKLVSVLNSNSKLFQGMQLTSNTYNADGNLESFDLGGEMGFAFSKISAVPYSIDPCYFVNLFSYMLQGEDVLIGMLLNQTVMGSKMFPSTAKAYTMNEKGEDVWVDVNMNTTFTNNVLTIDMTQTAADAGMYPTKITVTYEDK